MSLSLFLANESSSESRTLCKGYGSLFTYLLNTLCELIKVVLCSKEVAAQILNYNILEFLITIQSKPENFGHLTKTFQTKKL